MGETSLKDLALIGVLILGAPFIIQAVKGIGGFFGGVKNVTDTVGGVAGGVYDTLTGGGAGVPSQLQQFWGLQETPEGQYREGAVTFEFQEHLGLRETSRPDTPKSTNKRRKIPPRPALPEISDPIHDVAVSRIEHAINPSKSLYGRYKTITTEQGTLTIRRSGR